MRIINYNILILLFILTGCGKTIKEDAKNTETDSISITNKTEVETLETEDSNPDKVEIQNLIITMYRWHENQDRLRMESDLKIVDQIIKDSLILGSDMKQHASNLKVLEKTGFFAKEFLTNMTNIETTQNKMLKSGKVKWYDGDMSPFSDGSSPWCNCQDVPTDNDPYGIIKFTFSKLDSNEAILNWSWDIREDWKGFPNYKIRTVKEDGKWKIAWMQGWDHDTATTVY